MQKSIKNGNIYPICKPRHILCLGLLYLYNSRHNMWHHQMVPHVPSLRQTGRLLLSCSPASDLLFCGNCLAVPIYYAHMTLTCGFTSARLASSIIRCAAMMFHRYFRLGHGNRNWLSRFKFSISIGFTRRANALSLFHTDDTFSRNQLVWECVMGGINLLLTMDFVIEGRWLNHQIDNYHTQNYSMTAIFRMLLPRR